VLKALRLAVLQSLCVCLSATVAADVSNAIVTTVVDGALVTSQPDGSVIWKVRLSGSSVCSWGRDSNGDVILDNGTAIDAFGRIIARWHDADDGDGRRDGSLGRGSCPYWSALVEIAPAPQSGQSNQHNAPLFNSHGNAWVILVYKDGSDYFLRVRRSNGHDGTWGPTETISDSTNYVSGPEGAIDPDDNITIVFRDISGGYKLYAMRYEPGAGWAGPELVYTTGSFFQAIEAGCDHHGNVATVFDPQDSVWSVIYDAASGTWGTAHRVSPSGYSTILPTVVQNRFGDGLYLIYMVEAGGPVGLYAHRFDSANKTWGPAEFLPGSESVRWSSVGPASRFPATVDRFGEATMFWQSTASCVCASRTQAGVWQPAHEVLPPGPLSTDLVNFAHAAASEFGDAFGVITNYESGPNRLYAFRYRAGVGWDPPDNPYTSHMSISTRVRVSFYFGANAVATLYGLVGGDDQLISLLYDGLNWDTELLDIPEQWPAFFQEVEADRGESLLVMEAEELFEPNYGIWATWLRHLPGDLDGDGEVGQPDLGILLADWNCTGGDCPGDIDGDGDTDQADLGILLAHWRETCP
jgi:hypothetical protein